MSGQEHKITLGEPPDTYRLYKLSTGSTCRGFKGATDVAEYYGPIFLAEIEAFSFMGAFAYFKEYCRLHTDLEEQNKHNGNIREQTISWDVTVSGPYDNERYCDVWDIIITEKILDRFGRSIEVTEYSIHKPKDNSIDWISKTGEKFTPDHGIKPA